MAETILDLAGSAFYFSEDTSDAVMIPVDFVAESQPVPVTGRFEPWRAIDEKNSLVDVMFFMELSDEHHRERGPSQWKYPDMQQAACAGVDGGVQPVLFMSS